MRKIKLLLLLMLLPMVTSAHDFEVDGIYYNITNENEVAVTYEGSFSPYTNEYVGEVIIPQIVSYEGNDYLVTSIGDYAFEERRNLTSVIIPSSVVSIGDYALSNCVNLTNIDIPNNITEIGAGAFFSTPWYYNHPDGLVYIGSVVHSYKGEMPSGTSIVLKEGTVGFAEWAFAGCCELSSITIPNSVSAIDDGVFARCIGLTNIEIPNSVVSIGHQAFEECTGLTSVSIPNSVTTIGDDAFNGCTELTNIDIPNSVTSISLRAFENTPWYNNQPDGLVYAGLVAYKYKGEMPSGTTIVLKEGTVGIAGGAFDHTNLKSIEIPNSVTVIGFLAFTECTKLTNIEIPNSVTTIGGHAFSRCWGLRTIVIPNSITTIGYGAFNDCSISTLMITGEGEWQAGALDITPYYLYLDSRITSVKGLKINPKSYVYCYATIPPKCDENSFTSYKTLHVPAASVAAYFTAEYWCNFANIVGGAVEPEEVSINHDNVEMNLGNQFDLIATVTPTNATPNSITWESTNTSIATVYNGKITSVGAGECDIIARCLNKKAICHVVVNDTTVTITLDQQEASVLPNHIITLMPTASPVMPDLFVTSSDPSVAAARLVNNKIQVVGIKEGTTTITVGSVDGTAIPATCLVTVYTEPGDMNCDGFLDISDVTALIDYLLSGNDSQISAKNADVNGDESIDIIDVTTLIDTLLSGNG